MKANFFPSLLLSVTTLCALPGLVGSAQADSLDNWTSSQVVPNGGCFFTGVAYGNGRYVAVGSGDGVWLSPDVGIIQVSDDGMHWRMVGSIGDFTALYDVTFGNGTFVAVGWGGPLYYSTNGLDWTYYPTSIMNFFGVTYGAGLFVAVGDGSLVSGEPQIITYTLRRTA